MIRILLLLILLAVPAHAQQRPNLQSERERLEALQREQAQARERAQSLADQANQIEVDISKATRNMVDLAGAIQEREDRLYGIESQLSLLTAERGKQLERLNARRGDVARLLSALQSLSRHPPQLVLVRPGAAIDTARSAGLLKAVLPRLQSQTVALRQEVAVMLDFKAKLETERTTYSAELAAMKGDRGKLDALREQRARDRATLLDESDAAAKEAEALAQQARDVKELLAQLEKEERKRARLASLPEPRPRPGPRDAPAAVATVRPRPAPALPPRPSTASVAIATPPKAISTALGGLALPVRGEVITQFGQMGPTGPSRGIAIRSRADAQVVAPYAGRVVYAGPFRSLGNTVIIAHGEGYHSVLSGLTRIDARKDQLVVAGEPVGVMGSTDTPEATTLYVEIRRGGDPINPLPWLQAGLRKAAG